jgi:hypothetical protein
MTRKIPGFSNLSDEFASFLSEDHAAVSALFKTTNIAVGGQIPATRILFVYTHFAANGALEGAPAVGVRQVAQPSGSRILVVASLTPEDTIRNAMSFPGPNLVFTLDRKGPAFAAFFTALFESMRDTEDMLQAWAELAPQAQMETNDNPELYCCPRVAQSPSPRRGQA